MNTDNQIPLTETTFFILLSLAPREKHGYAIMKNVQQLSKDRINLSTGTLYGALGRLLDQGWIERVDEKSQESGRRRKVYRLSELGRQILNTEIGRLEELVTAAQFVEAKKQYE